MPSPPTPPAGPHRPPLLAPGSVRPAITFSAERLLTWSGITLVVLAAIFFVATAIDRGWIGPELQLAGATLIGLILVAGGFWFERQSRPWSLTLTVGGAAVLPVCAAAGHAALDLIPAYPALIALALVTIGLWGVAVRLKMEAVAAVAGVFAVFLPFWINDRTDLPLLAVGGWLAALVVAATGLGWHRSWVALRLILVGLSGLTLLGLAAEEDLGSLSDRDTVVALVVTAVVAAAAWAGPAYAPLKGIGQPEWVRALDHRLVLTIPVWAWGMSAAIVSFGSSDDVAWYGLVVAAGFALVAAATLIPRGTGRRLPMTLISAHLLGVGILASIAFATLTQSPTLLVGLAVQAAATVVLARLLRDPLLAVYAGLLGLIAVVWAAGSTFVGWFDELDWGDHLANLTVVVLIVAGAAHLWRRRIEPFVVPAVILAWIAALGWVPSVLVHVSQGQAAVSILWAIAAAGAIIHGLRTGRQLTRWLGLVTLVITLIKLLTVDLAAVDTLWRVALFLVIGAGLLRLGYVLPSLSGGAGAGDAGGGPETESQLR